MDGFDNREAENALVNGFDDAEKILQDEDRIERLLQRAEKKLRSIPRVGDILAILPVYISLIKSFVTKKYTDVPIGSLIAIVSAIAYVVSLVDLIPDFIPGAGYLDDAAVVTACAALVKSDVDEYLAWRDANGMTIED